MSIRAKNSLATWLILAISTAVVPSVARAGMPDKEKAQLSDSSVDAVATSPDGRLVVALGADGYARLFDAYDTESYTSEGDTGTSVQIDCGDLRGVFIGNASSAYYVHIPCGSEGSVYQFSVSEEEDSDGIPTLTPNVTSVSSDDDYPIVLSTSTGLGEIDAAAMSDDGAWLLLAGSPYLEGVDDYTSNTATPIYKLAAKSLAGTIEATSFVTPQGGANLLAEMSDRMLIIASGGAYLLAESGAAPTYDMYVDCADLTSPGQLLVLSDTLALLIDGGTDVYEITTDGSTVESCEAYDWGFDLSPSSMALVQVDGSSGDTADERMLYIRAGTSGDGEVIAYGEKTVLSDTTPIYDFVVGTPLTSQTGGLLAGSALSRLYLGSSGGLTVLAPGPWFSTESLEEPVSVSDSEPTFTLDLASDEDVTSSFYLSLSEPYTGSYNSSNEIDTTFDGDSSTTVELDTTTLSLTEGTVERVFIYGKDGDGNLGWTSIFVKKTAPVDVEDFEARFGEKALYLLFTEPDADSVSDVEILVATQAFTPQDGIVKATTSWDETLSIDGTTYSEASISIGVWDSTDSSTDEGTDSVNPWSVDGTTVQYMLYPLENGTTYYLCMRFVSDSVVGDWTEVVAVMPEHTVGPEEYFEGAGGYGCQNANAGDGCSVAALPGARSRPGLGLAVLGLLPGTWILNRRRRS